MQTIINRLLADMPVMVLSCTETHRTTNAYNSFGNHDIGSTEEGSGQGALQHWCVATPSPLYREGACLLDIEERHSLLFISKGLPPLYIGETLSPLFREGPCLLTIEERDTIPLV